MVQLDQKIDRKSYLGKKYEWDDLVAMFPGLWVVLDEVDFWDDDGATVKSGKLIEVAADDEIDDLEIKYIKEGKKFYVLRTEENGYLGVIHCDNYRVGVDETGVEA